MTVYDAGSVADVSGLSLDDVMRAGLETVRGQLGDEGSDLVVERLRQLDLVGMPGGVDSRWLPLGRVADWNEQGPSLDQVLRRSQEIRDQVNLGGLLKRGSELRSEIRLVTRLRLGGCRSRSRGGLRLVWMRGCRSMWTCL